MSELDWVAWHEPYDRPGSSLRRRLELVRLRIGRALDAVPPGRVRVISMCAGQGRDVLGALDGHPRRGDVVARLVEADPRNAERARETAADAGFADVDVVTGDASVTTAFVGMVPADVVLVCGVFGNISDADVRNTIALLPTLCRPGAVVIWTRHRAQPDLTPAIRTWFGDAGFDELAFDTEEGFLFGVGTHRLVGNAARFEPGVRLFDFVGDGTTATRSV